jgi:hypothetical protein
MNCVGGERLGGGSCKGKEVGTGCGEIVHGCWASNRIQKM